MLISWDGSSPKDPLLSASAPGRINEGYDEDKDFKSIADDVSLINNEDSTFATDRNDDVINNDATAVASVATEQNDDMIINDEYALASVATEHNDDNTINEDTAAATENNVNASEITPTEDPQDFNNEEPKLLPPLNNSTEVTDELSASDEYENDFLTTMGSNKYRVVAELESVAESTGEEVSLAGTVLEVEEVPIGITCPDGDDSVALVVNELDEKYDQEFEYSNDFASVTINNNNTGKLDNNNGTELDQDIVPQMDISSLELALPPATFLAVEPQITSEEVNNDQPVDNNGQSNYDQDNDDDDFYKSDEVDETEKPVVGAGNATDDAYESDQYDDDNDFASPEASMRARNNSNNNSSKALKIEEQKSHNQEEEEEYSETGFKEGPDAEENDEYKDDAVEDEESDSNKEPILPVKSQEEEPQKEEEDKGSQDDEKYDQEDDNEWASLDDSDSLKVENTVVEGISGVMAAKEEVEIIQNDSLQQDENNKQPSSSQHLVQEDDEDDQYLVDFDAFDDSSVNSSKKKRKSSVTFEPAADSVSDDKRSEDVIDVVETSNTYHAGNNSVDNNDAVKSSEYSEDLVGEHYEQQQLEESTGSVVDDSLALQSIFEHSVVAESPSRIEQIDFNVMANSSVTDSPGQGRFGSPAEMANLVLDNYIGEHIRCMDKYY